MNGQQTGNAARYAMYGLALLFVALAVIGGILNYTPVPQADMWDGYLYFFDRVAHGDSEAWLAHHNEHRILLSRLLFWVDISLLAGSSIVLVALNYVFLALIAGLFIFLLRQALEIPRDKHVFQLLAALVVVLCFFWGQRENMTWAFQSQFMLAQIMPLISFCLLARAAAPAAKDAHYFALACVAGIASVFTMANGILALPLMTVLALALRMHWQRVLLLGVLAVVCVGWYFHGFVPVARHGSLREALASNPVGLVQYVLMYISSPFYFLLGKGNGSIAGVQLASAFLILWSARTAWIAVRAPGSHRITLALLAFIAYVGATAVGTAGGRLVLGLQQAFSSRYETPAIMAWVSLLVLFAPRIAQLYEDHRRKVTASVILVAVLLLPHQAKALKADTTRPFEQWLGALALELQVNDRDHIPTNHASQLPTRELVRGASAENLSIFGHDPLRDAREMLGQAHPSSTVGTCDLQLDGAFPVAGDPRFLRIEGHAAAPGGRYWPDVIHVVDAQGRVVGRALIGVAPAAATPGRYRLAGYVLAGQAAQAVSLDIPGQSCHADGTVPSPVVGSTPE